MCEAGQSGNLLEEVGALLSDVQQTQSQVLKMSNSGGHQGGDSEGMFLGDSIGSIGGVEQSNMVSDGCSQVEEVVTEEIHQYQVSIEPRWKLNKNLYRLQFYTHSIKPYVLSIV